MIRGRRIARAPLPVATAPTVLATGLIADNEGDGVNSRTMTLTGVSSAGVLLLSWAALRTAIFAGPPTANNGNTYTQEVSQDYGPTFTAYSLRGYAEESSSGGSDHTITVAKSGGDTEELTMLGMALSGGAVVSSAVVNRVANGAGATHTSGTVTTTGPARLVAVGSGTGDVNATAPTQTWPGDWTTHQSVARGSAEAPNGHVPAYLMSKAVGAGDHSVQVQVTINEGLVISLYAVQP